MDRAEEARRRAGRRPRRPRRAELLARGRGVTARRIPLDEEREGATRRGLVVVVAELLREVPQPVTGRVVPAMRGVRLVRTLERRDGQRERRQGRPQPARDHSMSGAPEPPPVTRPACGLDAFAYRRRGMRPARKAFRPARTASRIASPIKAGFRACAMAVFISTP